MADITLVRQQSGDASEQEKEAARLQKKLVENKFTLEDFRDQLVQVRKMGSLSDILKMIPGMGKVKEIKSKDIGNMVAAMASPLFAKVTGAQIPVDGGNDRVI